MTALWYSLSQLFNAQSNTTLPQDKTVYCIETNQGKYFGRIIFQDDVVLRLATKNKTIKILKINIDRISTPRTETVKQHQEWLDARKSIRQEPQLS